MIDLDKIITRIDALTVLPTDHERFQQVLSLLEQGVAQPNGFNKLTTYYADRSEALILRPLTFLVARTISRTQATSAMVAAMQLLERLRCTDEATKINLTGALQLLAMYKALPEHAPPQLAAFLDAGLLSGPMLRDTTIPATATILAAGIRFTEGERARLRAALESVYDADPEWVSVALESLN